MENCLASCPATAAAAGAVAGLVIGFVAGRISKKGGAKPARIPRAKPQTRSAAPVPRTPAPAGAVEIYVGNLSYDLSEDELRKYFAEYGEVFSARIVTNRYTGRSKGFGFVIMPNRPEAEAAIAALNGKDIMGRTFRANEARNP